MTPGDQAQSSTPSLRVDDGIVESTLLRRVESRNAGLREIGRGPNGVLLIKGVLGGTPRDRSVPLALFLSSHLSLFFYFSHSFPPSSRLSSASTRNEPSRRQKGQGENGSAYRAGATVLTVPLSARHRETIITSHGSFDVPRRVRTPPRDLTQVSRVAVESHAYARAREYVRKIPARSSREKSK